MPFIKGEKGIYTREEVIDLLKEYGITEIVLNKGIFTNEEVGEIIESKAKKSGTS